MRFSPGFIKSARVGSITFHASATSGGDTITVPATVIAGDILVLHEWGDGNPTGGTPTGWTTIADIGGMSDERVVASYKLAVLADAGASITGLLSGGSSPDEFKVMAVFRPDVPAALLTLADVASEVADDPSAQVINASGGTPPLVALGFYKGGTPSMSPTEDGTVTGPDGFPPIKYKIYNSSPADVTVDATSAGRNCLASCYISAA